MVTNVSGRGKHLYEQVYCARGRMENLIKYLKHYMRSDKTACPRWEANQFRLFRHQGAYWLLHSVRLAAPKRSRWRGTTFATIRFLLVKVACRVEELRTRIDVRMHKWVRSQIVIGLWHHQRAPSIQASGTSEGVRSCA
jgi:hypothetical protein